MKNTYLLILFSYFIFTEVSLGQDFQLKNITEEQGLSSSTVWTIAQDKDGYIWFGTSAGLDRYDGKEFKHYSTKDGLPENEVLEIFTDVKSNRLYLQTFSNSFCYYENGVIINEKKNKALSKFKGKFTQSQIQYDGCDSNVAYVYGDRESFVIDRSNLSIIKSITNTNNPDSKIECFFLKDGRLKALFGEEEKLMIVDFSEKNEVLREKNLIILKGLRIKRNYRFNNKSLLIDLNNNIYEFNTKTLSINNIVTAKTNVAGLIIDKDSLLWYGKNDGVWKLDLRSKNIIHKQLLKGAIVTSIFEDNVGNIFISTIDNGVYIINNKKNQQKKFVYNGITEPINKIICFENKKIYGHSTNNYSEINTRDQSQLNVFDSPPRFNRTLDYLNFKNKHFILNEFGFFCLETKKSLFKINAIKSVVKIDSNTLLIGTARTLTKIIVTGKDKITKIDLLPIRVSALQKLNDALVLFGNLNDLYLYNIKSEKINKLSLPKWCSTIKTNKIILHKNGDAWILTSNHGILIYHNHKIKKLNDKGIFDEQNLKCISFQNDSVAWVGTETGLYKITYLGNTIKSYEKLEETEGMLSKKINDTYIDHDTLYVASAGGLNYFNIHNYYSNKTFKLVFQELKVSDSLRYSSSFPKVLSPTQTSISISYAGLYYGKTKNLVYYYRLIGSSNNWKSTVEAAINFAALKSNKYKIEIYAIDKNNPRIVSNHIYYEFEIEPHYYETLWFYVLIFILIILISIIIALLYNWRQKQKFIAENALNKKMNELELRALQSQLDPHFIFNSINAIKDFLNKNDVESTDKYLDEFAYLIRNTLDNSRHSNILLVDEKKYLNTYLKLEQLRSNNRFVFEITLSKDLQSEILSIPTMMLQPFAENCVRHGNVGSLEYEGNISIHFSLLDENRLKCSIIDNGVGYLVSINKSSEKKSKMRSHALQIQKERIALYNQNAEIKIEFTIEDRTDQVRGTKVEIILPILFYEEVQNNHH